MKHPQVDVRAIRQAIGGTQESFAADLRIALPTIRDWEQKRRKPTGAALTLLRLIEAYPKTIRDQLRHCRSDTA